MFEKNYFILLNLFCILMYILPTLVNILSVFIDMVST